MEHRTLNNNINAIKDVRKLFNDLKVIFVVKKQRELEKNSTKKKLPECFLKKKNMMVL